MGPGVEQLSVEKLKNLASKHPKMFSLLYTFNFMPAGYIHASHRKRFFAWARDDRVWNEPRAARHMSTIILSNLGLEGRFCFNTSLTQWPVALLDSGRLAGLARFIGAVVLGQRIRRSVSRDAVLTWKEKLTPEVYQFVMTSATLLPSVEPPPWPDEAPSVDELGWVWIKASIGSAPEELLSRASLKFPLIQSKAEPLEPESLEPEPLFSVKTETAIPIVNSVLSALEPAWCSLFAKLRKS